MQNGQDISTTHVAPEEYASWPREVDSRGQEAFLNCVYPTIPWQPQQQTGKISRVGLVELYKGLAGILGREGKRPSFLWSSALEAHSKVSAVMEPVLPAL